MNSVHPINSLPVSKEGVRKPPKNRWFKLTFNEVLTVFCTLTVPVAIVIYTAITTDQQNQAADRHADDQERIARDRRAFDLELAAESRQQQIYDQFINDIYTLHRDGELNESENPWAFANARYRASHRQLGPRMKAHFFSSCEKNI